MSPRPSSRKQARLFGAVAGGKRTKAKGMSPEEAKERLRGIKIRRLPMRAAPKRMRTVR